jgi:hypothetical protein
MSFLDLLVVDSGISTVTVHYECDVLWNRTRRESGEENMLGFGAHPIDEFHSKSLPWERGQKAGPCISLSPLAFLHPTSVQSGCTIPPMGVGKRKREDEWVPTPPVPMAGSSSNPIPLYTPEKPTRKRQKKKADPDAPIPEKRGASACYASVSVHTDDFRQYSKRNALRISWIGWNASCHRGTFHIYDTCRSH